MITFCIALILLVLGYIIYGRLMEKVFGADKKRVTVAISKQDGVDFAPMKPWKIFLIQFLNIAGLGPIFGAIMGAKFGVSSYLWIVFGCIFGGAMHDYLSGMISLRQGGISLPEIHGRYLGNFMKQAMRVVMIFLLVLAGVVFITGPANILHSLTPAINVYVWVAVIFIYYFLATMIPINKLIGRIYPLFGACLLFMAFGVLCCILYKQVPLPEIWDGLGNTHPQAQDNPILPMMFISIACGALSGFHASQSPMMARCMTNEKYGRPIFYGAMIAEGIIALIWAAAAAHFFTTEEGKVFLSEGTNAAVVVDFITKTWMGRFGAILAILGVVAAPITTGDTAFRSARLIVADFMHFDQKPIRNRLMVATPIFLFGIGLLTFSFVEKNGFQIMWDYFAWLNQLIAVVTLWTISVYLFLNRKPYIIALLPAQFMTMICTCFIFISPKEGLGLNHTLSYILSCSISIIALLIFIFWMKKSEKKRVSAI